MFASVAINAVMFKAAAHGLALQCKARRTSNLIVAFFWLAAVWRLTEDEAALFDSPEFFASVRH